LEAVRLAFLENMKQKSVTAMSQARLDKLKKAKYVCRIDYPCYWKFYKNPDRLYELQKKQDKYDFITRFETEHEPEDIFTSKDLEELQKLERDCLDFALQKDVKSFFKGCGEFGKGSLKEIREAYLSHLSEGQVKSMAAAIWSNFETIPNALKEFVRIEKCEYETWRKEVMSRLLSVFQEFESDQSIHLPLELIRSSMGGTDSKQYPPEYLLFLLHHFSLMGNELLCTGVAPLKQRIKDHEVLGSELLLVTQPLADHEKRLDKYCSKLLASLDKKLPAFKPITGFEEVDFKKCSAHGVFARTEEGVLSFDWARPAIDQLKTLLYRDVDKDLKLDEILERVTAKQKDKSNPVSRVQSNVIPEDDIEDLTQTVHRDDERAEDRQEEPAVNPQKSPSHKASSSNLQKKPNPKKSKANKMDEEKGNKRSSLFDFGIKANPVAATDQKAPQALDVEAPPTTSQQPASTSQARNALLHHEHPDNVDLGAPATQKSSSLAQALRPAKRQLK
jgi:hypothetical protein